MSSVWGPALWLVLHCISLNFPQKPSAQEKTQYRLWFEGLQAVLPCGSCRANFEENLALIQYDPEMDFQSRFRFAHLMYRLHTNVRERQKKSTSMSFMDSLRKYEQFRAKDCRPTTKQGEGGCFAPQPLTCTLHITPNLPDQCRFQVHEG